MGIKSFRDLLVWQKAMALAVFVYRVTVDFPKYEIYGLRAQLRDAASGVPSNIAEGYGRRSPRDFRRFLKIAYASLCETQSHTILSERLHYFTADVAGEIETKASEVGRMLNGLIDSIKVDRDRR